MTQVIFKAESWSSIGNVYWIQQAVDLVLALAAIEEPFALTARSARLSAVQPGTPKPKTARAKVKCPDMDVDEAMGVRELLGQNRSFVAALRDMRVTELMAPLRVLIHYDPKLGTQ
jgi:hypothetical protein